LDRDDASRQNPIANIYETRIVEHRCQAPGSVNSRTEAGK